MYCSQCGKHYPERVNFCSHCGASMAAPRFESRKLLRSRRDRKIAGVCGGFAEYLDLDATLVRLAWLMLVVFAGWGLLGYLMAWIIMPEAPEAALVGAPSSAPQLATNH